MELPNRLAPQSECATLKKKGNEFLAQGQLEQAAECYKQAIRLDHSYAEGFLNLGFVLKELTHYEEAEHQLKRAVQINPKMVDAYFLLGALSQEQGNLDKAIEHYNKVLELNPGFEDVYQGLCNVLSQKGEIQSAKKVIEQGISINPEVAEFHLILGDLYRHELELEKAADCYRRALSVQPDFAEAHNRLGNVFHDQGNLDMALMCYRRAQEVNPDDADVHNNMGSLFLAREELDKAETCFRKAIALKPDFFEAHINLGQVFAKQGNPDDALKCCSIALALRPDSAEAHHSMGNSLRTQEKMEEAIACFRKALAIKPNFPEAYNDLAAAFMALGRCEEAISCYQQALQFKPDYFTAHSNLGIVFQIQSKLEQALESYRQAIALAPELHDAKLNLLFVSQLLCEWEGLEALGDDVRRAVREAPSNKTKHMSPFSFLAIPGSTAPEQKICAGNWAQTKCQSVIGLQNRMGFEFKREPKQKLVIGYLSADFKNHPVSHLMARVFELHDRDHFEINAYSYGTDDGTEMRKRLEKAFDRFIDIRALSTRDASKRIFDDGVDILVDLTGYTREGRSAILALHPAPIQVNYLGYPGTMGADFVDYLIADKFVIPPEQQDNYSEKVVRLPDCFMPRDNSYRRLPTPRRTDCGLPNDGIVFCGFNSSFKITPAMFDIWCRLLKAVPGSVLWLSKSNAHAAANLEREAERRGVTASRIISAPRIESVEDHLARLQCADLFLDTQPYNAHTTCSDALWMGLPVITCAGDTFPSRVAGSLLTAIGAPELITYNLDDYYNLALEFATDREKREKMRERIVANRDTAPLFDSRQFTQNLEAAFLHMWHEYLATPAKH